MHSWHGQGQLYFTIPCSSCPLLSIICHFFHRVSHISVEWSSSWIIQSDTNVSELVSKMYTKMCREFLYYLLKGSKMYTKMCCEFLYYLLKWQMNLRLLVWIWTKCLKNNTCCWLTPVLNKLKPEHSCWHKRMFSVNGVRPFCIFSKNHKLPWIRSSVCWF
jgi:hypothetical protein